ncbi:unnamed protein product, partial [Closterium sp. NIES-53]
RRPGICTRHLGHVLLLPRLWLLRYKEANACRAHMASLPVALQTRLRSARHQPIRQV